MSIGVYQHHAVKHINMKVHLTKPVIIHFRLKCNTFPSSASQSPPPPVITVWKTTLSVLFLCRFGSFLVEMTFLILFHAKEHIRPDYVSCKHVHLSFPLNRVQNMTVAFIRENKITTIVKIWQQSSSTPTPLARADCSKMSLKASHVRPSCVLHNLAFIWLALIPQPD